MKKKTKRIACALGIALGLLSAAGCGAGGWDYQIFAPDFMQDEGAQDAGAPNYQYDSIVEQGFRETEKEQSSYFSLDRNTAGYSLVRAQINAGRQIASDSVRLEELINYFDYDFPVPEEGEIAVSTYVSDCPWSDNKLLTVGVRTEEKKLGDVRSNYVLLIDTSGSMSARVQGLEGVTCMDLVKLTASKIAERLTEKDSVSIVTYASGSEEVLEPVLADEAGKKRISRAVDGLNAFGSTYGSGGIEKAYENAEKYFSDEGNNRVILMTDGDFNVGISSETGLKEFIQEKAKSGVYLSVLGYGMGNTRDDFMQTLALNGNGNYAYIDTVLEAEKVCGELNGMLITVAKDAKAGVTFSQNVKRYRILGYDMKMMSESDFNNSEKDAGEIGSGLCVVAVYEAELAEGAEGELAEVTVRYKTTAGEDREVIKTAENVPLENDDIAFISCVAEFGLVLRKSEYRGAAALDAVETRLGELSAYLEGDPYKKEFLSLVQKAREAGYYNA